MLSDSAVERALVVMAHPDDADFSAAGTVAGWVATGIEVTYCIVTDGDAGGFDPAVPRGDIGGIRQKEQRAAADLLGVRDVVFLGYGDGHVIPDRSLRRDISRVIREVRPQRVICQSPERNFGRIPASHPDHMAAGEATLCAVYPDARNPFAFPELTQAGLEAWSVPEVWVSGREVANRYIDVTSAYDLKVAALQAHESQMEGVSDLHGLLHGWMGATARDGGLPEGQLAEAFWVIETA